MEDAHHQRPLVRLDGPPQQRPQIHAIVFASVAEYPVVHDATAVERPVDCEATTKRIGPHIGRTRARGTQVGRTRIRWAHVGRTGVDCDGSRVGRALIGQCGRRRDDEHRHDEGDQGSMTHGYLLMGRHGWRRHGAPGFDALLGDGRQIRSAHATPRATGDPHDRDVG